MLRNSYVLAVMLPQLWSCVMTDKEHLSILARLGAIELVLLQATSDLAHAHPDPKAFLKTRHDSMRNAATVATVPNLDPAQSDLFSAELEEALDLLLTRIENLALRQSQE